MRTCVDLFTGLGGFSLAARANNVRTIAMCEKEQFLREGLRRAWGEEVELYDDINTFDAGKYAGRVWLLCGGPPCQPASRAGKQGGEADDRWLWGPTVRVCEVIKSDWFLFENPPGIADVGLDGIVSELAGLGYEVQLLRIPACAVDSPQDRDRFWILGHRTEPGREGGNADLHQASERTGRFGEGRGAAEPAQNGAVADSQGEPSGGDEPRRRSQGRIALGWDAQSCSVAYAQRFTRETPGQSKSEAGPTEPHCGGAEHSTVAHGDEIRQAQWREQEPKQIGQHVTAGERAQLIDQASRSLWSDYQWLACPDRDGGIKVRRMPANFHSLAHGLQSRIPRKFRAKLISALGNAIVWRVASEVIAAMIQAEELAR